jgi:hypothetical protein
MKTKIIVSLIVCLGFFIFNRSLLSYAPIEQVGDLTLIQYGEIYSHSEATPLYKIIIGDISKALEWQSLMERYFAELAINGTIYMCQTDRDCTGCTTCQSMELITPGFGKEPWSNEWLQDIDRFVDNPNSFIITKTISQADFPRPSDILMLSRLSNTVSFVLEYKLGGQVIYLVDRLPLDKAREIFNFLIKVHKSWPV